MKLAIIGFGEFAKEVYDIASRMEKVNGIIYVDKDSVSNNHVVSENEFWSNYSVNEYKCVIGLGEVAARERLFKIYKDKGYSFANVIDPSAVISPNANLDQEGIIVFPHVYISHDALVSNNSVLHANVVVENNVYIGEHCFVSSCTFIGAFAKVMNVVFIGPNSTIRDNVVINDLCIVGMGTVVTKTLECEKVYVGNPVKEIRDNITKRVFS